MKGKVSSWFLPFSVPFSNVLDDYILEKNFKPALRPIIEIYSRPKVFFSDSQSSTRGDERGSQDVHQKADSEAILQSLESERSKQVERLQEKCDLGKYDREI